MTTANFTVGPMPVISAAQDLTGDWVNLGAVEFDTRGFTTATLYLTLDINSSANARVRAVVYHTSGGTAHTLPIKTVSASAIAIEAEYIEFNVDADQNMAIPFTLSGGYKYLRFQVQAGTVGVTAGQIDAASVIFS